MNKTRLAQALASPRRKLGGTHPGEMLRAEFMAPRGISADTALRLALCFGTTPDFWLNLPKDHELRVAREGMDAELDAVEPLAA